jgi:HAE1 family hydrophobic/amphiphilic exporter-1
MPLFKRLRVRRWKEQMRLRTITKISEDIEDVQSVSSLAGYEILTEGTGANSGTCLINLKSWGDRKHSVQEIIEEIESKSKDITGATIEFFQPPAVLVMAQRWF